MRSDNKHWWSIEEIELLEEYSEKGYSYREIAKEMTKQLGREYNRSQIGSAYRRYILTNVRPGVTYNWLPIGTEKKIANGYTRVKEEDGVWDLKHRVKYREYFGEIPKECIVIFANGNREDYRKENLIAITRNQLHVMNRFNLIKNDIEGTKVGLTIADIIIKTQCLKKNLK